MDRCSVLNASGGQEALSACASMGAASETAVKPPPGSEMDQAPAELMGARSHAPASDGRSVPRELSPNRRFTGWMALAADTRAMRSWLQADVARVTGLVLRDLGFGISPVPLDFSDLNHVHARANASGDAAHWSNWRLSVDPKGRQLTVDIGGAGGEPIARIPVMSLSRLSPGTVTINLEPEDADLRPHVHRLAARTPGGARSVDATAADRPLAGLAPGTRIVVFGHGRTAVSGAPWPKRHVSDQVGGHDVEQLVRRLECLGLPRDHAGTLALYSCSSAAGLTLPTSLAQRVQHRLHERGFRHLTIDGFGGLTARVSDDSELRTVPMAYWRDLDDTRARSDRLLVKLREACADARSRHAEASEISAIKGAITRENAHREVLLALSPALRDFQANAAAGEADERAAAIRQLEIHHVSNWWGRLGPGVAMVEARRSPARRERPSGPGIIDALRVGVERLRARFQRH